MTEEPRWTAWKQYLDEKFGETPLTPTAMREVLRDELRALELSDQLFFPKVRLDNYKWYANPVFDRGGAGAWDGGGVRDPMVVVNLSGAGATRYRMYYSGLEAATGLYRIGVAHSPDGITWTRYAGNPIIATRDHSWEQALYSLTDPYVIRVGDIWYMYYQARDLIGVYSVGVATSPDGLVWTKQGRALAPEPHLAGEDLGVATPIVYYNPFDGIFYMFFEGLRAAEHQEIIFTALATSTDGINFTKVKVIDEVRHTYGKQWYTGSGPHDIFKLGDLYLLIVGYSKDGELGRTSELSYLVSLDLETWYALDRTLLRPTRGETIVKEGSGLDLGDWIYWWYGLNDATFDNRIGLCRFPRLGRFQPMLLWGSETVEDTGEQTVYVEPDAHDKTFFLLSDQNATLGAGNEGLWIQQYDPVNDAWRDVAGLSSSVVANELQAIKTTHGNARMRISFFPTAQASVDAWCVIEE